jgi:hypothetical protein
MGQLESLRELSIAQIEKKKKIKRKKEKKKKKKKKNNIIMPWLFHLIGIPVNFEVLDHVHWNLI